MGNSIDSCKAFLKHAVRRSFETSSMEFKPDYPDRDVENNNPFTSIPLISGNGIDNDEDDEESRTYHNGEVVYKASCNFQGDERVNDYGYFLDTIQSQKSDVDRRFNQHQHEAYDGVYDAMVVDERMDVNGVSTLPPQK